MQWNTLLKVGSLALNVAQDDNVRELANLIHKGAKRRGVFRPYGMPPGSPAAVPDNGNSSSKPPAPKTKPAPPIPFAPNASMSHFGGSGVVKYLTAENAKKALDWAGVVKNLLVK